MRIQELIIVYFYENNNMLHVVRLPTIPQIGHLMLLKGEQYEVARVAWIEYDGDFAVRIYLKLL